MVYSNAYTAAPKDDIKPDQQIIYWSSARTEDIGYDRFDLLTRHYPDAIIIREPASRHPRIKREFANSMPIHLALDGIRTKLKKIGISAKDQAIFDIKSVRDMDRVVNLVKHATRIAVEIKDKRLCEMHDAHTFKSGREYSQNTQDILNLSLAHFKATTPDISQYVERNYPLIPHTSRYDLSEAAKNDLIDYINKKYEERKAK